MDDVDPTKEPGIERQDVEKPEVLDTRPGGPRRRFWIPVAVACCCLIVIGLAWRATGHGGAGTSPSPSAVKPTTGTDEPAPDSDDVSTRTTQTADLGWLHATTDYDIFLRTVSGVVRIRPKTGQIIRTSVPGLASSGPVTFLPVAGGAVVRPLDLVAGYRIPDDATARKLPASGGLLLRGPDDDHAWLESNDSKELRLVATTDSTDSGRTGRADERIPLPPELGSERQLIGDGQGYLLGIDLKSHTTYRLQPERATKLPIGRPIAVGPTRVLGVPATCSSSCPVTELGPGFTKRAHQPDWTVDAGDYPIGAVSDDGRTAVVVNRRGVPRLIDLASGKQTPAPMLRSTGADQLAFSPDGHWLFGIADDKQAFAVNVRTGSARVLVSEVTSVLQQAVRRS